MHARATQRNAKLQAELDQAKAEIRQLKAERFGKKSEKQSAVDRSHELVDPENPTLRRTNAVSNPDGRLPSNKTIRICRSARKRSTCPKIPWSVLAATSRLKTAAIVTTASKSKSKRPSTEKSFTENVIIALATVDNSHKRQRRRCRRSSCPRVFMVRASGRICCWKSFTCNGRCIARSSNWDCWG